MCSLPEHSTSPSSVGDLEVTLVRVRVRVRVGKPNPHPKPSLNPIPSPNLSVKTQCERLDVLFILVSCTCRRSCAGLG